MTDRTESFEVQAPPRLTFRLPQGEARIVEGEPGRVVVHLHGSSAEGFVVERRGDTVFVEPGRGRWGRGGSTTLLVELGSPGHVRGRLASAPLVVATPLESLTVHTASGDVSAGEVAGDASVKAASGQIELERVGGRLEVIVASGDVRVGSVAGEASVSTASGDVVIVAADGTIDVKSASGDVTVNRFRGETCTARTMSGDVTLGVEAGRRFEVSFQTLSGDVRTDFPVAAGGGEGARGRLDVKSMSGDIMVRGTGDD